MPRPYKPVPVPVKSIPKELLGTNESCPKCGQSGAPAIGRIGLRLVFRCERCNVNFFHQASRRLTHV